MNTPRVHIWLTVILQLLASSFVAELAPFNVLVSAKQNPSDHPYNSPNLTSNTRDPD